LILINTKSEVATLYKSFSSYPLQVTDYDLAKFIFTFKLD